MKREAAGEGRVEETRDRRLIELIGDGEEIGRRRRRRTDARVRRRRRPQRPLPAETAEIETGRSFVVVVFVFRAGADRRWRVEAGRGIIAAAADAAYAADGFPLAAFFRRQAERFGLRSASSASSSSSYAAAASVESQVFGRGGAQKSAERHLLRQRHGRHGAGAPAGGGRGGEQKLLRLSLISL